MNNNAYKKTNKSVSDLWDDDADDIHLYNELTEGSQASLQAQKDYEESEGPAIEDENLTTRRSMHFNNPENPMNTGSHDSGMDDKWDKYRT